MMKKERKKCKLWKKKIVANTIEKLKGFVYELFDEQVLYPWTVESTSMMGRHAYRNQLW